MNNEQQQIIDETYKNYCNHFMDEYLEKNELGEFYRNSLIPHPIEEFVNKCKTDNEFSEKWGLKIEERELSLEERLYMVPNHKMIIEDVNSFANFQQKTVKDYLDELSEYIPTRLITITYKDKTIESYEQYR